MQDLEQREIDEAPDGFVARAVNTAGHGWLTFVSPAERDFWLCVGAMGPAVVDALVFAGEDRDYEILCGLLGMSWEELATDLLPTVVWQQQCLRRFPPKMWAQFAGMDLDEVLEWRAEVMTMNAGEQLVSRVTGAEPRAIRN